jgi:ABC-type dipeptide/oligopeptide/nickel transport system ATPase component
MLTRVYRRGSSVTTVLAELSVASQCDLADGRCPESTIFAGEPRFLIADEMTAMLDAITQAQIWRAVTGYARERAIGMLVISHDQPLLARLCQRVVDMPAAEHVIHRM